jgi:hypothetical protein
MQHLIIEVCQGYEAPIKKVIPKKGDRDEIVVYEQNGYMHKGGAFPEPYSIGHQNLTDALPVGKYGIHPSSFVTDNYGKLALSKYNVVYFPIK